MPLPTFMQRPSALGPVPGQGQGPGGLPPQGPPGGMPAQAFSGPNGQPAGALGAGMGGPGGPAGMPSHAFSGPNGQPAGALGAGAAGPAGPGGAPVMAQPVPAGGLPQGVPTVDPMAMANLRAALAARAGIGTAAPIGGLPQFGGGAVAMA